MSLEDNCCEPDWERDDTKVARCTPDRLVLHKLAPCCLIVVEDFQFVVQHYFQPCLSGKFDFHSMPALVLLSSKLSVDDGMAHILQSLGMQLLWNHPCSR